MPGGDFFSNEASDEAFVRYGIKIKYYLLQITIVL
jgi:hypothetical protein